MKPFGIALHWASDQLQLLAHWCIADPKWRARNCDQEWEAAHAALGRMRIQHAEEVVALEARLATARAALREIECSVFPREPSAIAAEALAKIGEDVSV